MKVVATSIWTQMIWSKLISYGGVRSEDRKEYHNLLFQHQNFDDSIHVLAWTPQNQKKRLLPTCPSCCCWGVRIPFPRRCCAARLSTDHAYDVVEAADHICGLAARGCRDGKPQVLVFLILDTRHLPQQINHFLVSRWSYFFRLMLDAGYPWP